MTDADGRALLDVPGLGAGKTYRLYTTPYGFPAFSTDLTAAGDFEFEVGRLQVSVINGVDSSLLSSHFLVLVEIQDDESIEWLFCGTIDAAGLVRFDRAPGGSGRFVLAAQSPSDRRWVLSDPLTPPPSL